MSEVTSKIMWKCFLDRRRVGGGKREEKKQAVREWENEVDLIIGDLKRSVSKLCQRAVSDRRGSNCEVPESVQRRMQEFALELYRMPEGVRTFCLVPKDDQTVPLATLQPGALSCRPRPPKGLNDLRYASTPMPPMDVLLQGPKPMKSTVLVSITSFPVVEPEPAKFIIGSSSSSSVEDNLVRITGMLSQVTE